MRPLVERFDERVRHDMSRFDRPREPAHSRCSVLRDPASEEDIRRAEKRLGARLPPSYHSFLLLSNGAYASALGAEIQYPYFQKQWRHGLLRVADVDLTVNADPTGVHIWCEHVPEHNNPDNDFLPKPGDPQLVRYYSPYRDGVVVTHIHNGTNRLALVPRRGYDDWELWDFHWEGASAHPSFANFLEWFVARPDRRPKAEDADRLVTMFTTEGTWTLEHVAELGDPRVVKLAGEAIDAGTVDQRIPLLLGRMGGPDSLRLLHSFTRAAGAPSVSNPHGLGALRRRRPRGPSPRRACRSQRAGAQPGRTALGCSLTACGSMVSGMRPMLSLLEFPADDPERARRFWSELLGASFEVRVEGQGDGWQTPGGAPAIGVHARGRGPGDSFSLPYFEVDDLAGAIDRVKSLGGTVVHPGARWAICKDSEGSPFGLALADGAPNTPST